jgi:hypothetical protein
LGVPARTRLVVRFAWHVPIRIEEDGRYYHGRLLLRLSTSGKIVHDKELDLAIDLRSRRAVEGHLLARGRAP